MKRLVILIILLATPFLLFSESTERIITGIKKPTQKPDPFAIVNVFGPEREAIMEDSRIIISDVMRNKTYNAFSWVFTGNCFRSVKLKYTFSPLTCSPNLADATKEEIIPYTVTVSHESTSAGGKTISDRALDSSDRIKGDFDEYYYRLAESVTYNGDRRPVTLTISGMTSQSVTLDYNLSLGSIVEEQTYKNHYEDVTRNYTDNVCCLWTRTGSADIVLKVTDDGFSIPEGNDDPIRFTGGEYTCTVSVEITSGS